ncbi:hypothetical protein V8D89_001753 [Ganoderma adspersum]
MQPSWYLGYITQMKCEIPSLLSSFALEYRVDSQEPELLHTLAAKFPHLTTFEVHRFRSEGSYCAAVTAFAQALVSLASLRLLKLHLDFPDMPRPNVVQGGI